MAERRDRVGRYAATAALIACARRVFNLAVVGPGYSLRLLSVVYAGKPLSEPLTILYDKRRPLPPYAKVFCEMLAQHAKQAFPVKRIARRA